MLKSEIECCGIFKTISFKKCRYVCISSINFWVQLKMFAMFHSFWKLQNCMVWVCPFFPRHFRVFFLALFDSCWKNCFCRNNEREMYGTFQGTRQGSQQYLGQRQKAKPWAVLSNFPAKLLKKQQGGKSWGNRGWMCAALWCSVLSGCATGGLIFYQRDHCHKPCIPGFLSLLAALERQMCRVMPGTLGASFILVHPISCGGSAGLCLSVGLPS